MDTDKLNRWLALLANFSVVAGIIFLAFELRQNNELLQFEVDAIVFDNMVWGMEKTVEEPSFAELMFRARNGDDISDAETYRVRGYYRRVFRGFQWEYQQAQKGRLEIESPQRWAELIQENKYSKAEWEWGTEHIFTPEFVRFVEVEIFGLSN